MNLKIKKYKTGKKGAIYSLIYQNETDDALSLFMQKYYPLYKKEVESIVNRLQFMLDKSGFLDEYFISESPDSKNMVYKVMYLYSNPKLRLACIKLNRSVIIIGGGAVKKTQKWQEDEELSAIFKLLIKVDKYIANNEIDFQKDIIEIEI
jgi:hypothetical protein